MKAAVIAVSCFLLLNQGVEGGSRVLRQTDWEDFVPPFWGPDPNDTPSPEQPPERVPVQPIPPSNSDTAPVVDGSGALLGCNCPAPPQFNPVCGSDGVTYGNMQKLDCAQSCGKTLLSIKSFETAAYGHYPYTELQNHNPIFASSSVANYARREPRPLSGSDFSFKEIISGKRDLFYSRRPGIHGPQIDIGASNFHLPGQTQPLDGNFDGFARPSLQNSPGRRRQLGSNSNSNPNLFLPPVADDPDDIFIFDRPTSPNPRPVTTVSSTTTRMEENCDCPSTPEYNPVCGSDGNTYTNPGRLKCAIFCGTDVSLKHRGTCVTTTATSPPVTSPVQ